MPSLPLAVIGAIVSTVGAVLVAWPIARLTRERIAEIAATKYDANPDLSKALLEQRRFAGYGILAIVAGTAVQVVALAV